jgi:hypothetical protein
MTTRSSHLGDVAQWIERSPSKRLVVGSNPSIPITKHAYKEHEMSEISTKNMSKAKARQSRRGSKRTDKDIQAQIIRKLRRIKKSSGNKAVAEWMSKNIKLGTIRVGRGDRTMRRINVQRSTLLKAVGIA